MQDGWMKIGVLGCNSVIPRNVNEPPTGEGTAVGNAANAATADSLAVGDGAAAHGQKSVAIGSGSVASNDNECSVGAPATESTAESTREVTHVSDPTAPTSAANKAYVDGSINVIAPKTVATAAVAENGSIAMGEGAVVEGKQGIAIGKFSKAIGLASNSVGYNVQSVGTASATNGVDTVCIGNNSFVAGYDSSICATQCVAIGSGTRINGYKVPDVNVKNFKASVLNSVALGSFSVADENRVVSVGNDVESVTKYFRVTDDSGKPSETEPYWGSKTATLPKSSQHLKRRIIHVADPIDWHNAANKNYVDTNTSNALVGTVSGKLLHVEDAWPGKPLSLTIDGAYKQDGTPSPEAPVPITVIENPILKVTGRNLLDNDKGINNCFTKNADGTYTITKISDNERFSAYIPLRIPNGVNAYLSVTHMSAGVTGSVSVIFDYADGTQETSQLFSRDITAYFTEKDVRFIRFYVEGKVAIGESFTFLPQIEYGTEATLPITLPAEHPYLAALPDGTHDEIVIDKYGNASLTAIVGKTETAATDGVNATVGTDALSSTGAIADGATVYYKLAKPVIYPLGKLDIPSLPETISNVLTDAELTTNMSMTYKRDINTLLDRDKLPIASTTNRGTVKVGYGLDVDADGTLWVTESDSIPLAQTVTVRTSEKNFAVTGSPNDVASQKALMPVFNCGGYYSTFGGYFYLNLANSYKAGTKIHIELDVVWQDTHICSPIHRVAVVEIQQNTYTIPFGPSMYRDPDYNWYYWSFDVPVTADVPAKTQIHVNVF